MTFNITSVQDNKWNDTAFKSLVLPSDHKELILALTESQIANKETFDDVIQGKGIYSAKSNLVRLVVDDYCREGDDYATQWSTWCGKDVDSRVW